MRIERNRVASVGTLYFQHESPARKPEGREPEVSMTPLNARGSSKEKT